MTSYDMQDAVAALLGDFRPAPDSSLDESIQKALLVARALQQRERDGIATSLPLVAHQSGHWTYLILELL